MAIAIVRFPDIFLLIIESPIRNILLKPCHFDRYWSIGGPGLPDFLIGTFFNSAPKLSHRDFHFSLISSTGIYNKNDICWSVGMYMHVLSSELMIKWKGKLFDKQDFPNCFGCVDGKRIRIWNPRLEIMILLGTL